ncbi:ABC transporter substrate-binding protein [Streptomyces sp.]|uniref:ABC transporter substrate-binding protein n=1 Tax=Streptomyces sp. TaxID=1931 RepID=UPI002F4028FE
MVDICRLPFRRLAALVVGLVLVTLAACAPSSDSAPSSAAPAASDSLSVQHAGGTLKLPKPAVRVAAMQWQFVEDLVAMGVQPTMIADEQVTGSAAPIPPQVKGKIHDYVSLGSRVSPNLEVLASQPVDLIIADKNEHLKDYAQFSKIAPTLILDTTSWADFFPNLEKIGQAVGRSDKAAEVEKSVKDKLAEAKAELGTQTSRALLAVPTPDKFFAFTANSMQAGILGAMGLTYAYQQVPGQLSVPVDLEKLPPTKPDVVFLAAFAGDPKITDKWKGNPLWTDLPAVRHGRVALVDRGIWSLGRGPLSVPLVVDQTLDTLHAG